MPRPQTKDQLIKLSEENFNKIKELIASYSEQERNASFQEGTLNRNIRDIITHLHHWHIMAIGWYKDGIRGNKPEMPAKGYSWKTLPKLNREIWKMYQKHSLKEAQDVFSKSHKQLQKIIRKHTEEELFEKKKFKWTGSTSMAAYFISATSSHYAWGYKMIKRAKK